MKRMHWLVGIGVAIGAPLGLLVPSFGDAVRVGLRSAFDRAFPVIEARAQVTHRTPSEWLVVMYSNKFRDCQLIEMQAYDAAPNGEVTRLEFAREDGKAPSGMPPGKFRSATYEVRPAPQHELKLSFLHRCDHRVVRTPVYVRG